MKTFQIQTLGCKVNTYESEFYRQTLLNAGYLEGLPKEKTDLVIINTCTVTNTASFKSRQKIAQAKRTNPDAFVVVVGCYVKTHHDFLKEKYGVDIVFNDRYDSCNNINSLYIVRDRFHDTYVMEGDVYMDKNVLLSEVSQSTYFAKKKKYENEWGLEVGENNKLVKINIGAGNGFLMSGI